MIFTGNEACATVTLFKKAGKQGSVGLRSMDES